MSLRASLIWRSDEDGDVELASAIGPHELMTVKHAALRDAQHKVAANVGDEVRELKFQVEYQKLKELLDYVLPERTIPTRRMQEVRDA